MNVEERRGVWIGVGVTLLIVIVAIFSVGAGYDAGLERGRQEVFESMKQPLPGQLMWMVEEQSLYMWDGEVSEWVELCKPCPKEGGS